MAAHLTRDGRDLCTPVVPPRCRASDAWSQAPGAAGEPLAEHLGPWESVGPCREQSKGGDQAAEQRRAERRAERRVHALMAGLLGFARRGRMEGFSQREISNWALGDDKRLGFASCSVPRLCVAALCFLCALRCGFPGFLAFGGS